LRRRGVPGHSSAAPALAIAVLVAGWIAPDTARAQVEPELEEADLETLMNTPIEVWTATKTVQKSYEAGHHHHHHP
jgi:hypothetical protein